MNEKIFDIILILCITIVVLALGITMLDNHEETHRRIMERYGCSDVEVHINYFTFEGYAKCLSGDYVETEAALLMHENNELFIFHTFIIVFVLYVGMMLYILKNRRHE
jgi:hypothetical protein